MVRRFLITLVLSAGFAAPALADFDSGMAAYRAKDFDTAFAEFEKEAFNGHDTAQFNLGVMYYRGEGVNRDLVQAYSWIELSTQRGDPDNIKAEEVLILMLTPDQLRAGLAQAQAIAQKHGLTYTPPDLANMDSRLAVVDERD